MNEQEKIDAARKAYPYHKDTDNAWTKRDREIFIDGLNHRDSEVSALRERVTKQNEGLELAISTLELLKESYPADELIPIRINDLKRKRFPLSPPSPSNPSLQTT